jgi:predicted RNA binding protein YcfA (HicA-like mRNA interferase family)
MHAGKDIKPKTLAGIIEDMGLTQEEFRRLL